MTVEKRKDEYEYSLFLEKPKKNEKIRTDRYIDETIQRRPEQFQNREAYLDLFN